MQTFGFLRVWVAATLLALGSAVCGQTRYAVVVSRATQSDTNWQNVVSALVDKYHGPVLAFEKSPREVLPRLQAVFPRHVCFVVQPEEASREFVAAVQRLTRELDADPYTDVIWGILTGYDAANALEMARLKEPLKVRRVAAGTDVALDRCEQGVWYCELKQGHMVRKQPGGEPTAETAPPDTTAALVAALSQADLFVTSGHATERDWQIGYRYRNGAFKSEGGQLYGLDTKNQRYPVQSSRPKVYMPVGNCLMGHIDSRDALALAFMKSAGVCQMLGYTVPTWYGYAGWGCLDYFVEQPGRFTFAEAYYANLQALVHRLTTCFPDVDPNSEAGAAPAKTTLTEAARAQGLKLADARGLLFDRDTVAFYGDPAWEARMAPGKLNWEQTLTANGDVHTFEIRPLCAERTFDPVNTNGSQRGHRPVLALFESRLELVRILEGQDLSPVITDNFILIPNPRRCDPGWRYRVVFEAKPIRAKRVLILGDSISIGYTPFVRELLAGEATVVRPTLSNGRPENCDGTSKGVKALDRWLQLDGGHWDVIHFNFGLHDLKRVKPGTGESSNDPAHPRQAEPEVYERQLGEIVAKLKATGANLIFATTTPVPPGGLNPHRDVEDVIRYNRIAVRIMREQGVVVDDLYSLVLPQLDRIQRPVNVHFTAEGYQLLGAEVARQLRQALKSATIP